MTDRVTSTMHAAVLTRDRACVLAKLDPDHECRDTWGNSHASTRLDLLTIEHVKDAPRMGKRAPSDMAHMVALCAGANLKPPSKAERALLRAYLAQP